MANTEIIDQLVSQEALKSLDTLNAKLASSYDEMEKLLAKSQDLSVGLAKPAKSYAELAKTIEKVEKAEKSKEKVERDIVKTTEDLNKVTNEVINSSKEQTKEIEKQEEATKNLERTTSQLVAQSKDAAKGINISAFIRENEKGMKDYSGAINELSQNMGRIQGLQEALNEKFQQGAITEAEYATLMAGLSQTFNEHGEKLAELQVRYEQSGEAQRQILNPASEAFASLTPEIQRQALSLVEMNVELNNVRTAQKDLDDEYKSGKISLDEYVSKKAQLKTLETDQADAIKKLSKELQLNQQIANTAVGSYDNLSAQYSLMKIEINALGEAEGENAIRKRELETASKALYERMNELQMATGKAQLQVGDYAIVNKDLESALSKMNPALAKTISGIQGMTKAAIAFIATPVGVVLAAIAAALALVTSWFKRSEEGQNALAVASAAFEQVLSAVLNIASKVGEWLYKMFTDPKEAVRELGEFIQSQITNRLDGIIQAGEAIGKIFSGEVLAGFKDLGSAVVKTATGVDDVIGKIGEIADKAQQAADIQKEINNLATEERELGLEKSKTLARQNELRNISNDAERTHAERLKANNEYIELTNKLEEKTLDLLNRQLRAETDKMILQKGSYEALSIEEKQKIADLEAKTYEAQAAAEQKLFTATRTNNRLRREAANEAKKAASDAASAEKERVRSLNKELKNIGELESFNYRKSAEMQERLYKDATLAFDERRDALRAYIDDEISIIKTKEKEEVRQEGLTQTQIQLIKEKALYEIYKLEQKFAKESKDLNIKEAEMQVKKIQETISERSEVLNQSMQNELVAASKNYEDQIRQNINFEDKRTKITESYQKQRLEIIRKFNQEAFEFEIGQLSLSLENAELTEEKKIEIRKKIDALQKKNAKEMADFEIKNTESKVDKMLTIEGQFNKLMRDKRVTAMQEAWSATLDTMNMYFDEQLSRIDEVEKREKGYWDDKLKMIDENLEAGLMSEETADAHKRIIEESQLQREKEFEQQRKEMQRKQAAWQKANAIIQAMISTGLAVTSALATPPFPLGLALSIVAGAMGAAQIAMIASQSIPSYAKGTENHPGGLARVGDGGRSEMIILPSGEIWKTPAKDTFINLPKGSEVLPDYRQAFMNIAAHPVYDDSRGELMDAYDDVLRENTKAMRENTGDMSNHLCSIKKDSQAMRANSRYAGRKAELMYRINKNMRHK